MVHNETGYRPRRCEQDSINASECGQSHENGDHPLPAAKQFFRKRTGHCICSQYLIDGQSRVEGDNSQGVDHGAQGHGEEDGDRQVSGTEQRQAKYQLLEYSLRHSH